MTSHMTLRRVALSLAAIAALSQPARALTFSFSTVSGDSLSTAQAAAFQAAANVWSANLVDAITVNLQIGFRSLADRVLGQTSATFVTASFGSVRTQMAADAKDATDAQATASLATGTASTLQLTSAQAKALGYGYAGSSDGTIEFSSNYGFSTARDASDAISAGTYDLVGIAEHEIGHLLGFISGIDGLAYQTLLDQFRYGSTTARSVAAGASAYFSVDGGVTHLANFSVGGSGNSQASHWLSGSDGVMVPEVGAGQTQNISALDIEAFDALGYDLAPVAVPEPVGIGLLAIGLIGATVTRRRSR